MTPMILILIIWLIIVEVAFLAICFAVSGYTGFIVGLVLSISLISSKLSKKQQYTQH